MNDANAADPRPIVDCDRESWVKSRLRTTIRMALAIQGERRVGADTSLLESAFDGLANGAAIEIISCLGLQPGYVNLRRTHWSVVEPEGPWPGAFNIPKKTNPPQPKAITGVPQTSAIAPQRIIGQLNLDKLPEFEGEWKNMLEMCARIQQTPEWKLYWKQYQKERRIARRKLLDRLRKEKQEQDRRAADQQHFTAQVIQQNARTKRLRKQAALNKRQDEVYKTEVTDSGSHTPLQPVDVPNEALRVLKAAAKATQQMPPLAPGYLGDEIKKRIMQQIRRRDETAKAKSEKEGAISKFVGKKPLKKMWNKLETEWAAPAKKAKK